MYVMLINVYLVKGPTTTSSAILLVPFTKCFAITFYYHISCYFMFYICICKFTFEFGNKFIHSFIHLFIHSCLLNISYAILSTLQCPLILYQMANMKSFLFKVLVEICLVDTLNIFFMGGGGLLWLCPCIL